MALMREELNDAMTEKELDNYKMFVLDLDENDNGKVKFKIGIYEDNN